jgi:hypothetical protein
MDNGRHEKIEDVQTSIILLNKSLSSILEVFMNRPSVQIG